MSANGVGDIDSTCAQEGKSTSSTTLAAVIIIITYDRWIGRERLGQTQKETRSKRDRSISNTRLKEEEEE